MGSASSGHAIVVDAGKEKTANSPVELVLIALCGCTASDVVSILRKKREPFTGTRSQRKGERSHRLSHRVHRDSPHLSSTREGVAEGDGRRGAAIERKVLLGVSDAGEDSQDHLHDRVCGVKSGAHPLRGYLYIASAALFWGIAATLGRAAFTGRLPVAKIGAIDPADPVAEPDDSFASWFLLPVLLLRRGASALRVPSRDLVRFLLIGVLGVAASNYLYYLAIQRTNVATAIILQYTAPVWVLLIRRIARRAAAVVCDGRRSRH